MTDESEAIVPVWTLATGDVQLPAVSLGEPMTSERLSELRTALAAFADRPIATLEVHPLPSTVDLDRGIALDAASPLAQHLSRLISESARRSPVAARATADGDALYRMVVPAKVAAEFGEGTVRSMPSNAAAGGIHGALLGAKGVTAQATFVPVNEVTAAGGVARTGTAAGAAITGGAAVTVAAPLVLMAVAVGMSAAADQRREEAIRHITKLLEQVHEQRLEDERSELDGCRDAIDKATAILLDEGKLGISLGLDSAVHAIGKALASAERRLARWQKALDEIPNTRAVDVDQLSKSFPGIDHPGGTFRGQLEVAALAVALKRRVIVLQSVEHAQLDPGNVFEAFVRALKADQQRLNELESGIAELLKRIATLQLTRPRTLRSPLLTPAEADRLLRKAYRIRALGESVALNESAMDVAIEIARRPDGSVVVLPAMAA